jgi:hypothetical protein
MPDTLIVFALILSGVTVLAAVGAARAERAARRRRARAWAATQAQTRATARPFHVRYDLPKGW